MPGSSSSTPESRYEELSRLERAEAEASRQYELMQILMTNNETPDDYRDMNTGINPDDYIDDEAEYEAWLQNLSEGDGGGGGRRGAPPAAKSAVEALETFEVGSSERTIMDCVVCKDAMAMGEIGKKLPCGHSYHGNCILPWLRTRNSCPLCRFELQTEERLKRGK